MTQSDLLQLLGLKVNDARIIVFFEERKLTLPKSVPLANPGSGVNADIKSIIVHDKEWGFSYCFQSELLNEHFPLVKEGRNYIPYLTQVSFYDKLYAKRQRKEPATFWNISPAPDSSIEAIELHFGEFDRTKISPSLRYAFNQQVDVIATFLPEQNRLRSYFATVKEAYAYLDASLFDTKWSNQKVSLYAMLIKWLYDNQYLKAEIQSLAKTMESDTATVLHFVQVALKGHLWDNQLIADTQLHQFILASLEWEFDFTNKFYRQWDRLEYYESLNAIEKDKWTASVPFNDETYAIFHTALNESFKAYKAL